MINADKKKEMKNLSEMLLETRNLTKQYGHHKAVDSVNMHIKKGAIYGFIGRNGAGKTTCLKMISGLYKPTCGEIEMFGNKGKDLQKVRSRIGCLIEAPGLYGNMTAYENLNIKCKLFGIKKKSYIEEILRIIGLEDVGKKKTKHFSLGMKQRLGIGLALVGDPDLLVLDEPINGLDPQGIAEIRDTIQFADAPIGVALPPISVPIASAHARTVRLTPATSDARSVITGIMVAANGMLSIKALATADTIMIIAIITAIFPPLTDPIKPARISRTPVSSRPLTTTNSPTKNSSVL